MLLQTKNTRLPSWQQNSLMAAASPSATIHPPHNKNCSEMAQAQSNDPASKLPKSQYNWASVGYTRTTHIHGGPIPQPTRPKRSTANVPVPDTTGHSPEVLCPFPSGSKLFWQHEGDLDNTRHVVLILWLISIYKVYTVHIIIYSNWDEFQANKNNTFDLCYSIVPYGHLFWKGRGNIDSVQ